MRLKEYNGKRVKAIGVDGKIYTGKVLVYIPAPDNDPEEDAILLDSGWGLNESDIKEISIIK